MPKAIRDIFYLVLAFCVAALVSGIFKTERRASQQRASQIAKEQNGLSSSSVNATTQPSRKELLDVTATQLRKRLPMMADAETRLDSATPSPDGLALSYDYTLINFRADQLSTALIAAMKQNVINQTCATQANTLLAHGFSLEYRYRSKDGILVENFRIGPNKCTYDPSTQQYWLAQ